MGALFDLVNVTVTAGGTGTITVGGAVTGFLSFSEIPDGTLVSYAATDGTNREVGTGVKNGSTLTRTLRKSSTGALLNLSTAARISIVSNAGDFNADNLRLPPRSGQWFGERSETGSGAIFGNGTILYTPIIVPVSTTIDRIGLPMQSGGASMFAKCGLFASTADRVPGAKVVDCASPIVLDGYGFKLGVFGSNPLVQAGLYWVGSLPNSGTPQPKVAANWAGFFAQNSIADFTQYWSESNVAFYETTTYAAGLPAVATPVLQIGWNTNVALLRAL